jgi:uncharacterized membrane protein
VYEVEHRHRHSHSHSHTTPTSVSAHTRRIVLAILIPAGLATLVGLILLWPGGVTKSAPASEQEQRAYGDVTKIVETPCPPGRATTDGPAQPCGAAQVVVTGGPGEGTTVVVDLPRGPGAPTLSTGDQVVLAYTPAAAGGPAQYVVVDHQRGRGMLFMLVLCAAIIVAFGRWRGFTAIIGLLVGFALLLLFVLPAILNGESPLLVAIVGSAAIMFAVLYLTHGLSIETSVAILGTLAALVLTGLLGAAFTALTKLTGFGTEESMYLSIAQGHVDMRGLFLAGIIIGALGVLDDLTVTQASTVAELAQSPTTRWDLYRAGTRVGRAHVASAVNTIVLAYAGASLPLLLLITISGRGIGDLLTSEFLAQEIVRSAVGTIGLVAAVPITTGLAALVADVHPVAPSSPAQQRQRHAYR